MKADAKFCVYTGNYRWTRELRDQIISKHPTEYKDGTVWVNVEKNPMVITVKKTVDKSVFMDIASMIAEAK